MKTEHMYLIGGVVIGALVVRHFANKRTTKSIQEGMNEFSAGRMRRTPSIQKIGTTDERKETCHPCRGGSCETICGKNGGRYDLGGGMYGQCCYPWGHRYARR